MPEVASLPAKVKPTGWFHQLPESGARVGAAEAIVGGVRSIRTVTVLVVGPPESVTVHDTRIWPSVVNGWLLQFPGGSSTAGGCQYHTTLTGVLCHADQSAGVVGGG